MTNESMTALVEFQIRPETTSLTDWLEVWNKRAEDARDGEPETTAYAASVNVENELNVLVYERYQNGSSSLKAHSERPAHAALMETMGAANMTKRRVMSTRFVDLPDYGWWGRPGSGSASTDTGCMLIVVGLRLETDALEAFIRLSAEHADYCRDNEPDTLIYSGGIAAADADREIDVKKGDLIFVMGTTDEAARQRHAEDPKHLVLGPRMSAKGVEPVVTFRRTYRTTGNGFLWRD